MTVSLLRGVEGKAGYTPSLRVVALHVGAPECVRARVRARTRLIVHERKRVLARGSALDRTHALQRTKLRKTPTTATQHMVSPSQPKTELKTPSAAPQPVVVTVKNLATRLT